MIYAKHGSALLFCLVSLSVLRCSLSASPATHLSVRLGRQADEWVSRRIKRSHGPSSSSLSSPKIPSTVSIPVNQRGGATTAAVKTMTATQMEAFNLLSGGAAGTVAACLTNPLEVVKAQLQSSNTFKSGRGHPIDIAKRIVKADGPAGFFRGLPPTLVGIIPSRSIYFYVYQRCKHALGPYLEEGSPPNSLLAGLLGGLASNAISNPIWMVRTRMQLLADTTAGQKVYTGYRDAVATIFREEGIGGFYKGIQASFWGCSEGALQFMLYERFKVRLLRRANQERARKGLKPTDELSHATIFWAAAAAKMAAAVTTYPHEVARTRMREQAQAGVFKYRGMWQTLGLVAREEGYKGLYGGMGIHLVKVVPNSAFMFLTYEVVRSWLSGFTIVEEEEQINNMAATSRSSRKK